MCLRFADRPCFIAADPTIFSPKIKKTRPLSGPAWAVPDFSTGIQIFRWFYSIRYIVCSQTFYGYLRILSIHDGDVLVAFRFKKCDHQDQKSLFKARSHHQMTWDIQWQPSMRWRLSSLGLFPASVIWCCKYRKEERKKVKRIYHSQTTLTGALLFTRMPDMFLLFSVY